ncbi:MAG: MFS transporter [Gammaproteobacteria bacterium]|nr:MFS transporter [Gammaproteobacteria bacterium]
MSVSRQRAIIAFTLGTLFFAYAFIQRVSPSVMTSELMRDFSVGGAALGSLSAFYFYSYASIQLPVGMLTDHFGPRKLMSGAAVLCALASIGFGLSDSILTASLGRALIGATVAFGFVGTMAIAGYWFKPSQYAMLAGFLQAVGMSGAIFGQAPLRHLVEGMGWRGTMYLLAVIAVMLAVLVFTLVPQRSREQKQAGAKSKILDGLKEIAHNFQTWVCAIIGFGMAATMLGFGGLWGVPWLSTVKGYSTVQAAGITSMLFVGWACLSPLLGWLSDRIQRRNLILQTGAVISLLSLITIIHFTPHSTVVLMAMIFLCGAGGSAMTVCFSSVKELNSLNYSSTSLGLMNMCIVGSGAVMQPLIGWLLDLNWDDSLVDGARIYSSDAYVTALSSLIVVNTAALLASFILRETHCRQIR